MKKIGLVITAVALPGEKGYSRFEFLSNFLVENGFEVELITTSFQHWDKKQRDKEKIKKLNTSYKITLIDEPGYNKNIDLKRIYSHKILSKNLKKYLSKNHYDLLYCVIPDNFVAAETAKNAKEKNIPLIIDVEDLWPEIMKMVFNLPIVSNLIFYPFSKAAKETYCNCSGIIGSSEEYMNYPFNKYIKNKDIPREVVYVGNEVKKFDEGVNLFSTEISKESNEFWIIYAGTFGESYDLSTLILASEILYKKGYTNIKIKLLGGGPDDLKLKTLFKEHPSNIEFLGYLPFPKMAAYLNKSNVCINSFVKKAPQSIVTKIGDYLASGNPMINTCSSIEFKNKVEKDNFGINVEAENPEILAEAILYFYKNRDIGTQMGKNARKIAEQQFDRPESYKKIVNLINKLLME